MPKLNFMKGTVIYNELCLEKVFGKSRPLPPMHLATQVVNSMHESARKRTPAHTHKTKTYIYIYINIKVISYPCNFFCSFKHVMSHYFHNKMALL